MERREHPRYLVSVEIEVKEPGCNCSFRGTTTDISLGGCYIATIFPLAVASAITFTLWIGGRPIRGRGSVQTRHPGVGMGIKFEDLPENVKAELNEYLQSAASMPTTSLNNGTRWL